MHMTVATGAPRNPKSELKPEMEESHRKGIVRVMLLKE